jgi:hypothetical protein
MAGLGRERRKGSVGFAALLVQKPTDGLRPILLVLLCAHFGRSGGTHCFSEADVPLTAPTPAAGE